MYENPERVIAHCSHCGHRSPQELQATTTHDDGIGSETSWAFLKCLTCRQPLLYRYVDRPGSAWSGNYWHFEGYRLIWPEPASLHEAVPDRIRTIYAEAARIKKVGAPNPFANSIGRALEALCKDRGAWDGNLSKGLKELQAKGEIPQNLAGMTEILRQLRNAGSHDDDEPVRPEYVEPIDEFFRAIVEYVYVAPFKVEAFKQRLEDAKKAIASPPAPAPKPQPVKVESTSYDDDIPF